MVAIIIIIICHQLNELFYSNFEFSSHMNIIHTSKTAHYTDGAGIDDEKKYNASYFADANEHATLNHAYNDLIYVRIYIIIFSGRNSQPLIDEIALNDENS